MKRHCKNVDISDREFIKKAVWDCLKGNGRCKLGRSDTLRMLAEYSGVPYRLLYKIAKDKQWHLLRGLVDTVIDGIRQEILDKKFIWKAIWYTTRFENGKVRRIGIQDIKQQLYDYIAVIGLTPIFKRLGYYQCAALPGKGQVMGMRAVRRWLRNKAYRYAWKGDARKYYENIDTDRLKEMLKRCVNNKLLLKLTFALIDSFERGLSIGSYLSQYLANFYMSFAVHFANEALYKIRRKKDGSRQRVRLVYKSLFYMDDILLIGKSKKDMATAVKTFGEWMRDNLRIEIKQTGEWIDLRTGYIDMMGFLISRDKVIVRPRIFRRYRKSIRKARKTGRITVRLARAIVSRDGWAQNAQCRHWMKRNKANRIIEIAKGVIKNGKDVICIKTATSDSDGAGGRIHGCDRPCKRGGDHRGDRGGNNRRARWRHNRYRAYYRMAL